MIRPQIPGFKETITAKDQTSERTEDWDQKMSYEVKIAMVDIF